MKPLKIMSLWLLQLNASFLGICFYWSTVWATEDETVGWHHRLSGQEFEQALGDSEGQRSLFLENPRRQRSLTSYSPWGRKEGTRLTWLSTQTHTLSKLPRLTCIAFPVSPRNLLYFPQSVASSELTAVLNFCHHWLVMAEHDVNVVVL